MFNLTSMKVKPLFLPFILLDAFSKISLKCIYQSPNICPAGSYAHTMRLINRKRNPNFYYNLYPGEIAAFFFSFESDNWENVCFTLKKEEGGGVSL